MATAAPSGNPSPFPRRRRIMTGTPAEGTDAAMERLIQELISTGWTWSVFGPLSSAGPLAFGIEDSEAAATGRVEQAMIRKPDAAFGGIASTTGGKVCRRTTNGGFHWWQDGPLKASPAACRARQEHGPPGPRPARRHPAAGHSRPTSHVKPIITKTFSARKEFILYVQKLFGIARSAHQQPRQPHASHRTGSAGSVSCQGKRYSFGSPSITMQWYDGGDGHPVLRRTAARLCSALP